MANVFHVDPIIDSRWPAFLETRRDASVFHTPAWLAALRQTYGYEPVVVTTTPPGRDLTNGIVFCRIRSRLTGRRLVSVPFSDHCDPLADAEACASILAAVMAAPGRSSYTELRPRNATIHIPADFTRANEFWFHALDLRPRLDELFGSFHRDCVQRKIRRAERESLVLQTGRSEALLRTFYRLLLLTRRRLGVPAQPLAWFRNIIACLGENAEISVALRSDLPIASMMTLRYNDLLVYKYGCSDAEHNRFGGVQFLFWRAIQQAKEDGIRELDFGRTDDADVGLAVFKDRWGCARSRIAYWRTPPSSAGISRGSAAALLKPIIHRMPLPLFRALGLVVTRHLG